jgi:hypothetical protein
MSNVGMRLIEVEDSIQHAKIQVRELLVPDMTFVTINALIEYSTIQRC